MKNVKQFKNPWINEWWYSINNLFIHSIKVIMIGFSDIEDSDVSDDQEF